MSAVAGGGSAAPADVDDDEEEEGPVLTFWGAIGELCIAGVLSLGISLVSNTVYHHVFPYVSLQLR
jgi:hypothetical protein